jgi:hypothetical protein
MTLSMPGPIRLVYRATIMPDGQPRVNLVA